MNKLLRILHLEDDPDYSDLVHSMLETENIKSELILVNNRPEFEAALALESFDLILADYSLPDYNGLQALTYARQHCPELPFLLISGAIGEPAAIDALKAGATDYVLKHFPDRLVPAIRRAAQEFEERTQRRRAETELIRREKYFRALSENSLDILTILDSQGVFVYNSPSIKRVLGHEPHTLAGQSAFALVHPDDLTAALEAFNSSLKHPEQTVILDFRFQHRDGSWRHLEAVGQSRLNDPYIAGVVVSVRDVTDRKKAEQSLRESEQQYRLIFDGNPTPMFVFDQDSLEFLEVNDAALQHYGYSREEFLSLGVLDIRSPEEGPSVTEHVHPLMPLGPSTKPAMAGVWRHRKKNGNPIDMEIKWSPISFKGRAAWLVMGNDITERKRIEHRDSALAKLGQHLSSSRSPTEAAQIIHSVANDLFQWNSFSLEMLDEDSNLLRPILIIDTDAEGRRFDARLPVEGHLPNALIQRVVEQGAELMLKEQGQQSPEGQYFPVCGNRVAASIMVAPIRSRLRAIGVITVNSYALQAYTPQDLGTLQTLADHCGGALERIRAEDALHKSEAAQRRLEDQLRQSQKMEAIGQLAGGVAHDFNNILTVIQGHASLLQAGASLNPVCTRSAQQIGQAAERAAALTRQLLTFSRRQMMQPRRLDLNEVVCNMTQMLGRILGEDITLQLEYSSQPALVRADASMMEQVLLNLAVNSRDAMPKGGQLIIRISVDDLQANHLTELPQARAGNFVRLSVIDTGCGITPENLPRIFEPFFTTKAMGKGTGLGLATVYGIAKQHNGWIDVKSEPGRGSTFNVFVPCIEPTSESSERQATDLVVRGGAETLLVVEDESAVRELVCNLLLSHGYTVLQAESGVKALELWHTRKEQIDLVLTDLVMPEQMNGRELAEKLWADRPHLKIIFTSGYSMDVVGSDFVLRRGINYLQKPYPPAKLALMVRSCLDEENVRAN